MLTSLRLRDYKSYRGDVHVPLRRLTVLLGKNNSGKTAAARLPLLLFGALGQRAGLRREPLPRSVRGLRYGSSMIELVHGESPHSSFGIGCTMHFDKLPELTKLDVDIQLRQALSTGLTSFVRNFAAVPLLRPVVWDEDLSRPEVDYGDPMVGGFDGLVPRFTDDEDEQAAGRLRRVSAQHLDDLVHLTSLRRPLQTLYENRSREGEWDPEGSDVPFLLNESDEVLAAVARWYWESLETRIGLSQETSAFRLISPGNASGEHSLARAGQGIQQVLPVVTHLRAMALKIGPRLLVIEEPELNLHPAAHGALADLVVEAAAADERGQLLVETHSENLVLRLRYHVAKGNLRPDDVNLLWFQHREGSTQVREIFITEDGAVTEWPTGVFAEDLAEARAIAKASRS
jgi:hypothetical protein